MDGRHLNRIGPRLRKDMPAGVERLTITARRNWKLIGGALAGLIFAHFHAWTDLAESWPELGLWDALPIAVVIVGWGVWLIHSTSEFWGTETVQVHRRELVLTRGIGPLRRSFRFPASEVRELTSDGPATDADARPRVHHIFLKPKLGSVRFEWGGKTHYFADTVDEATGAAIVQWLRPRLPRSAVDLWRE